MGPIPWLDLYGETISIFNDGVAVVSVACWVKGRKVLRTGKDHWSPMVQCIEVEAE